VGAQARSGPSTGKEVILLKFKAYALVAALGTFASLLANTGWGP
jgi:hypothetical protein